MKLEQVAHKHTLTGILKVLLFALLMLAPIFSVASRCLYVICNKNAYQSYSGQTSYNINYKYESDNLEDGAIVGHIYQLNLSNEDLTDTGFEMDFTLISGFIDLNGRLEINDNYIDDFEIFPNISYGIYENNLNYTNIFYSSVHFGNITCDNAVIELLYCNDIAEHYLSYTDYNEIANVEINNEGTLDNVFTYSVNEMKNDQLFNWTQNTAIYTGINTMTTGIGITQETIPILLTYWFLLTIIYVIVDIIINTFTLLTHFIQKKTN